MEKEILKAKDSTERFDNVVATLVAISRAMGFELKGEIELVDQDTKACRISYI